MPVQCTLIVLIVSMIVKKSDIILKEYTPNRWEAIIKGRGAHTNCGGRTPESTVLGVLNYNTCYIGTIYTNCFGYTKEGKNIYKVILKHKTGYQRQITYHSWSSEYIFECIQDSLFNQFAIYTNNFNYKIKK